MIISMKLHSSKEEIEQVCERIRDFGYKIHAIEGEERVVIAAWSAWATSPPAWNRWKPCRRWRKPCASPRPTSSSARSSARERSRIRVNGCEIGGDEFIVMAGPCSVESEKQIMQAAEGVAARRSETAARRRLQTANLAL